MTGDDRSDSPQQPPSGNPDPNQAPPTRAFPGGLPPGTQPDGNPPPSSAPTQAYPGGQALPPQPGQPAYPTGQPAPPTQAYPGGLPPQSGAPFPGSDDPTVRPPTPPAQPYPGGGQYPSDPNQAVPTQIYGQGQNLPPGGYPPAGGYPDSGYPGAPQNPLDPQYQQAYAQDPQYQQPYPQEQYPGGPQYPGYPPVPQPNSGGNKALVITAAILVPVLIIGALVGFLVWKNHGDDSSDTSARGTSAAATTTESESGSTTSQAPRSTPAPVIPPSAPAPADTWISAGYDTDTGKVTWVRSTISSDDATAEVMKRCPNCAQPPAWARNACVAVVVGNNNAWSSTWGATAEEAESKATDTATTKYGATGPFNTWSKCATDN